MAKVKAQAIFGEQASKALERQLIEALTSAQVTERVINVWNDKFEGYRDAVKKYFEHWLNDDDANRILIKAVNSRIPSISVADLNAELNSVASGEQILEVASDVVTYLSGLPRKYEILFPLPNFKTNEDVILSDTISIILTTPDSRDFPLGFLGNAGFSTYLKIQVLGYASLSRSQSAMRDATSILKRVVQVGVTKNVFVREPKPPLGLIPSLLIKPAQDVLEAIIYDTNDQNSPPSRVMLGLGMSSYLSELAVFTDSSQHSLGRGEPMVKSAALANDLTRFLQLPVELLTSADMAMSDNSTSLRSAFEWAFDAGADDEIAPSFIKTCIALEASLAEESEEGGITERLADRCAFLLCKTPIDRKFIRDRMRQVYRLRSKLVHGMKTSISHEDQDIEIWGKVHLHMVLHTELKALEAWWKMQGQKGMKNYLESSI